MKQVFYNSNNIYLNYLGAYAQAQFICGNLCLINTLTDRQVVLKGKEQKLHQLHHLLKEGASDEMLMNLLAEMRLYGKYEVLLQEGLIE